MPDDAGDKRKNGPSPAERVPNPHGQPCDSCGEPLAKTWVVAAYHELSDAEKRDR